MKTPEISIIIPYKNAAAWLPRCVSSLKRQNGEFEFIFVDDHSTDGSYDVLYSESKEDNRFVRITEASPDFYGVSGARNTGVEVARGEYITFLDADDELLPGAWDKFKYMLNTEADIHQANHLRHYARKGTTSKKYYNPEGVYDLPNLPEMWAPVWNKLYKAELAKSIKFDEALKFGEDEIYNAEALARSKRIHCIAAETVKHNIENPDSLSHTKTDEDLLKLTDALTKQLAFNTDRDYRKAIYNTILYHFSTEWFYKIICE